MYPSYEKRIDVEVILRDKISKEQEVIEENIAKNVRSIEKNNERIELFVVKDYNLEESRRGKINTWLTLPRFWQKYGISFNFRDKYCEVMVMGGLLLN